MQDKNWRAICQILAPLAGRIFLVPVNSERTSEPAALAEVCRAVNSTAEVRIFSTLAAACGAAACGGLCVITGSLYLIGEAMEILGIAANRPNERALNEWSVRPAAAGKRAKEN